MSSRERTLFFTLFLVLLPVASFLVGYLTNDYVRQVWGAGEGTAVAANAAPEGELALFDEAWNIINQNFIGDLPNDTQRTYAAIRGSLNTLEDPYTIFLEPVAREEEKITLNGNFGGIGATLTRDEIGQLLLAPIPKNPAANAGILEGDVLLEVDGTQILAETPLEEIQGLIRGEKGTSVELVIFRPTTQERLTFTIERDDILVPSVLSRILEEAPTIGYIQLSRFSGESLGEIEEAVATLTAAGAESLILDLRGNGGGLLDASIEIADLFVAEGDLLYQESRNPNDNRTYTASEETLAPNIPLAILVDGGTASASEILAGALRDSERAILVGQTTFGKGSVQLVFDLSDGSSIHVTASRWFTPKRVEIDQLGLEPDILVEPTAEEVASGRDVMLERAVEALGEE